MVQDSHAHSITTVDVRTSQRRGNRSVWLPVLCTRHWRRPIAAWTAIQGSTKTSSLPANVAFLCPWARGMGGSLQEVPETLDIIFEEIFPKMPTHVPKLYLV